MNVILNVSELKYILGLSYAIKKPLKVYINTLLFSLNFDSIVLLNVY